MRRCFVKYILKNIKAFVKTEKMIFLLIIMCIITSSFIINFSYGLYQNYHVLKEEEESELYEFNVLFNNSKNAFVSKKELKNAVLSFTDTLNESIDMYLVEPLCDEFMDTGFNRIVIRFSIKDRNIMPCDVFESNMKEYDTLISGRYFSDEEEKHGERVALAFDDIGKNESFTESLMIDDDTIQFQGNKFKIIGIQKIHPLIVPFNSLEDDTPINNILFSFKKPITRSFYDEIKNVLISNFGNLANVPDIDIPEAENYYLYNTIILISIMIAFLAAINFAILYKYILSKRTKSLAIFRICGCTKAKVRAMFISECMIIAVPLFAATTLIYDKFVLPKLGRHFEYIESAYSIKLYLLIFGIYIATTFVVLLFMISGFLKKTIRETKEEK